MLPDKRYKVYINFTYGDSDFADNWIQCYPDIEPFTKKPHSGELFTRYEWGEVIFRNMPFLSGDAYELYDTIYGILTTDITREIRIKVTVPDGFIDPNTTDEIQGYFGANDCTFDHDKKIVKVTPTVLDNYTDVLENWETEVDVVGASIDKRAKWVLPDDYATNFPLGFDESHAIPLDVQSSEFTESEDVVLVYASDKTAGFFRDCFGGYSVSFRIPIVADLTITSGTVKFYLNLYDSDDVLQDENLLESFSSSGSMFKVYTLSATILNGYYAVLRCEISGVATVNYETCVLELTATSTAFSTTDVNINIFETYRSDLAVWNPVDGEWGKTTPLEKDMIALTEYFENDGSPKDTLLTENSRAPYSRRDFINVWTENGRERIELLKLYLTDIIDVLDPHGYELSSVTVYKGDTFYRTSRLLSRKRRKVYCEATFTRFEAWVKSGELPTGTGWTDTEYINSNRLRLYVKKPYGGAYSDGYWELGDLDSSGGKIDGYHWNEKITSSIQYPNSSNSVTVQSRSLHDVLKTVYNGTHPALVNSDVKSVFFWNDADSDITVPSGENYATELDQKLTNIACVHTYQFMDADEDSDNAGLQLTLKETLTDLKALFNNQLFWFVDDDLDLHIEHIKYLDKTKTTLDLTTGTPYANNIKLLTEMQRWSYQKEKMYSRIELSCINSGFKDFTDNLITFDKIVSNKRNEDIRQEVTTKIFSTDIRYCVLNSTDLENGLLLVNHDSSYNSINALVPIAGTIFENGNLALSNLIKDYRYEGTFTQGKINGDSVYFPVTSRTKLGTEFTIKGIYDYDFFKNIVGVGMIQSLKHDLERETTTITLVHRFDSDAETDVFELMVSKVGDYTDSTDVLFDFG